MTEKTNAADERYHERLARHTPDSIREMSPQQAGVELERLSARYRTSQADANGAQVALDKFTSDPGVAERLFAGDVATVRQFHELSNAVVNGTGSPDHLAAVLTASPDTLTPAGQLPPGDTMAAVQSLRDVGVSDGAIAEAFLGVDKNTGEPFDAATVARAKALRAQRMADPEWTARLFAGGYLEKRELANICIIISQGTP